MITPKIELPDPKAGIAAALGFASYVDNPDASDNFTNQYNIVTALQQVNSEFRVLWSSRMSLDFNYVYVAVTPK